MKNIISYFYFCVKMPELRNNVSLLFGLILNGFYIVFNIIFGIVRSDAWFIGVSAYYLLMLAMRYAVFDGGARASAKGLGISMLIISFPMSGMIFYKIFNFRDAPISGFLQTVFAFYFLYSVFRVITGFLHLKKKKGSLLFNSVRLVSVLYSYFSFQETLLPGLNLESHVLFRINLLSGIAVSASVLMLSFFMIFNTNRAYL